MRKRQALRYLDGPTKVKKGNETVEELDTDYIAGDAHGLVPLFLTGVWGYTLETKTATSAFTIDTHKLLELLVENEEIENAEVTLSFFALHLNQMPLVQCAAVSCCPLPRTDFLF